LDCLFATDIYGSLSWEGTRNSELPIKIGERLLEKYLFRGPEELFNLDEDPNELPDLLRSEECHSELSTKGISDLSCNMAITE
jgi:N-sulfoglucosamine sulfohydrolase